MKKIFGDKNFYVKLKVLNDNVTGSCNHLTFHLPNGKEERLLIDCGFFREKGELKLNGLFPFNCGRILAVLVTHVHSDHCGRIPHLFARGFIGKVYGSGYTIESIKKTAIKNYYQKKYSEVKLKRQLLKKNQLLL